MRYHLVKGENFTTFDSLEEVYIYLEERMDSFCYVESEDGTERFPEAGEATEGRVKGMVAWKLLETGKDYWIKRMTKD